MHRTLEPRLGLSLLTTNNSCPTHSARCSPSSFCFCPPSLSESVLPPDRGLGFLEPRSKNQVSRSKTLLQIDEQRISGLFWLPSCPRKAYRSGSYRNCHYVTDKPSSAFTAVDTITFDARSRTSYRERSFACFQLPLMIKSPQANRAPTVYSPEYKNQDINPTGAEHGRPWEMSHRGLSDGGKSSPSQLARPSHYSPVRPETPGLAYANLRNEAVMQQLELGS